MNFKFLYSSIFYLILIGCNSNKEEKLSFFGGTIQNPVDDKVLLMKNGEILDSIHLMKMPHFILVFLTKPVTCIYLNMALNTNKFF